MSESHKLKLSKKKSSSFQNKNDILHKIITNTCNSLKRNFEKDTYIYFISLNICHFAIFHKE